MARVWCVIPIVVLSTAWLYILTSFTPKITENVDTSLKFPSTFSELKNISNLLKLYYKENWLFVILLFSSAYMYKQAFIIPGSVFMNVLGGALFGVVIGFPLCCFLTAIGASCCFIMSKKFGRDTLQYYFPNQIEYLRCKVQENSDQLVYFLLFLRLFPMTPNWLINLLSPIIGVPLHLFFFTVFIGLMPYNFLCVQAGGMLASLTSLDEVFSIKTFLKLACMAVIALGPSFILKRTRKEFTEPPTDKKVK
ncbi:transmembrane protein 41A-like [Lycorma delicatula]|uniref:transmembrane protein 41A-like n=1 Tax=Lycorma delicatula TaxID=130591 RepID=UPI003F50DCB3